MIEAVSPITSRSKHAPLIVSSLLVLMILSMILPLPAWVLDAGIALSISTATMVFVIAILVDRPTDFQAFPILLLIALAIRLSLNVSSTRLILTQGQNGTDAAGEIIAGFSEFVAGNSLLVGLTIFAVISVVNFMVITKGSGRMAEVSARFALDSLPGKQLAIDADLNSGLIDHAEARRRRLQDQQEINFFGSLDGASKFVKGDAIAGLVITMINLIVGIAFGIVVHGMPAGQAMDIYSRLTIGDGLVTQVPALITSMGTALLLSRGGATMPTSDMLTQQVTANWRVLAVVAGSLLVMSLIPGMPRLLFITLAAGLSLGAWRVSRRPAPTAAEPVTEDALPPARTLGDDLDMDDISVEIGRDLILNALDPVKGMGNRITNLRTHIAREYGVILPEVRITDSHLLDATSYVIRIQGVVRGKGGVDPHRVMALGGPDILNAIDGPQINEPVYGTPAKWINPTQQEDAAIAGASVITPIEVISTHLMEVARRNLPALMTFTTMQRIITELKAASDPGRAHTYQRYFDSMMPDKVTPELLLAVLRQLLDERLSVRNLPLIIDAIYESRNAANPALIYEAVRKSLRAQITQSLADPTGQLSIVQMHPAWEAEFAATDAPPMQGGALVVDLGQKLATATRKTLAGIDAPDAVLATPDHRRRQVRDILLAHGIDLTVISLDEIDAAARLRLVATIEAA